MATKLPVDSGLSELDVSFQDFFPFRTEKFELDGGVWKTTGSFRRSGDSCYGTIETDALHIAGNEIVVNKTRPIIGLDINDVPVKLLDDAFKASRSGLITSFRNIERKLNLAKYTQDSEPSGYLSQGALWLNTNTGKLSIYYDSDWSQLN